mgnify:CR=1 FL=1
MTIGVFRCTVGHTVIDHDTTASIHQRLALGVTHKHLQDALFYYRAVRAKKVVSTPMAVCESDKTQRTIDSLINFTAAPTLVESRRVTMLTQLRASQRELQSKQLAFDGDVQFIDVFRKKSNRNNYNLPFKGIGRKKLLMLIDRNVTSAKELLAHDGVNPVVKPAWKHIMQNYYDGLEHNISRLKVRVECLQRELDCHDLLENMHEHDSDNDNPPPLPEEPPVVPFSKLDDSSNCNGRCISKSTIDRVVCHDHQERKSLQDAKMRNIRCRLLKIDSHYKLPSKIKVFTGCGKSFSP